MPQHLPLGPGQRLYLVDGSAYIFRAYHALPSLTRKSDGLPVGAVSGFCSMLWKLLGDAADAAQTHIGTPTHFAVIFDHSGETFRNRIYPAYKAHRPEPPEDLRPQFAVIRDATRAFGLPCVQLPDYEADDIIATHARMAEEAGAQTIIVSSDKDLTQLVSPLTVMFDPMKNIIIDENAVLERFGVPPAQMIDLQALMGDSADNVPGVPGIGPKTAAQLLATFGSLDALLTRTDEIPQQKRRETIADNAEAALLSRRLVALDRHAPVTETPAEFGLAPFDHDRLLAFLTEMEFGALARRIRSDAKGTAPGPATAPRPAAASLSAPQPAGPVGPLGGQYETVTDPARLAALLAQAQAQGFLAIDTETTGLNAMGAGLVGFSLALQPGVAAYVPLAHGAGELSLDDAATADQMPMAEALALLAPVLADPSVQKIGQNIKFDAVVLGRRGLHMDNVEDTMLMSYATDNGLHGHGMDELAERHLAHRCISFAEVAGTGRQQKTFDQVPIAAATAYAAEDADVTLRLNELLRRRMIDARMTRVYATLDRPLLPVIVSMEMAGIKIDPARLADLSAEFVTRMAAHEAAAQSLAGEAFNLGSPKQIGEILFGKLGLPGGKKTKTGVWSTDAEVLDDLAAAGNPVAAEILSWRGLSKLKGTYTDALAAAINPATGRVHTSFGLAGTTTGRLSSNDPNLQNIPIRTEDGRKIREAFIAEPGHVLISADYSQIELRLLAHIADIPALKRAFRDGLDIHAMTASEVFGIPIEGMDPAVRRQAKAINFGIIYGISAFGLARQLSIPQGEASAYIKAYFAKFPGIRRYMDDTIARARADGFVETLFGRRAHMPNIKASVPAQRAFAERQAINAPIQGSAADIVKRAMIRVPSAFAAAGLSARLLLQVHDELVVEAPEHEADATIATLREVMENATGPALQLDIPLTVEARAGRSWGQAH